MDLVESPFRVPGCDLAWSYLFLPNLPQTAPNTEPNHLIYGWDVLLTKELITVTAVTAVIT